MSQGVTSLYVISIVLAVVANVLYHIFQKSITSDSNPLASLVATYVVALVLSLAAYPFFSGGTSLATAFRKLGWASYALGVAIILLELGFLLAYRAEWKISLAALYANVAVALVLLPIGLLFFREGFTLERGIGFVLCLSGLFLLSRSA